ncbi:hypothetical protein CLU79DRAFT_749169 [Phycomyces nitens]|nr:hypothetical protein CLU79DRAFT_749169 [Phycomyces nitens]
MAKEMITNSSACATKRIKPNILVKFARPNGIFVQQIFIKALFSFILYILWTGQGHCWSGMDLARGLTTIPRRGSLMIVSHDGEIRKAHCHCAQHDNEFPVFSSQFLL